MTANPMDKSADAFRTISEVAADLAIPQHVLRFWETRFPQLKPLKRAGGRRYYRPADVELLRSIRRLLYDDGYTIKGVQRLFKERGGRREPAAGQPAPGTDASEVNASAADALEVEPPDGDGPEHRVAPAALADGGAGWAAAGAALRDALAAVEECERILAALRAPS